MIKWIISIAAVIVGTAVSLFNFSLTEKAVKSDAKDNTKALLASIGVRALLDLVTLAAVFFACHLLDEDPFLPLAFGAVGLTIPMVIRSAILSRSLANLNNNEKEKDKEDGNNGSV